MISWKTSYIARAGKRREMKKRRQNEGKRRKK